MQHSYGIWRVGDIDGWMKDQNGTIYCFPNRAAAQAQLDCFNLTSAQAQVKEFLPAESTA